MNREWYLKNLINKNGYNMKDFAKSIEMPYSTLLSILNGSVGGASLDNIIKICKGLNITISTLQEQASNIFLDKFSPEEQELIKKYRELPQTVQATVKQIVDNYYTMQQAAGVPQKHLKTIDDSSDEILVAAYKGNGVEKRYYPKENKKAIADTIEELEIDQEIEERHKNK